MLKSTLNRYYENTIFILALFIFSFSLESSTGSENLTLEQSKETIHHSLGYGQFMEIEIPIQAVPAHLGHGDHFGVSSGGGGCTPPDC